MSVGVGEVPVVARNSKCVSQVILQSGISRRGRVAVSLMFS